MKIPRWLVLSGLGAGLTVWMYAQTTTTTPKADQTPAPSDQAAAKTAPATTTPATPSTTAKPAAKKAKTPEKKKEVEPKIPGITINRANGTFLGLEVVSGKFKLSFYDAKKKPMAPDVTRATARWPNKRSATPNDYRTVLNPSGGSLVGAQFVYPPYAFNVYLTLLQGEGDDTKAVDSFVVPLHD